MVKPILTEREQTVIKYLTAGLNNGQISQILNISVHTVKAHLETIYEKLGVTNRVQAVIKAITIKCIDITELV